MEMLNNILGFFNNYGWPGIVAIVLILVIYWLIIQKDKFSLKRKNVYKMAANKISRVKNMLRYLSQ